jgi:hypothetical protein
MRGRGVKTARGKVWTRGRREVVVLLDPVTVEDVAEAVGVFPRTVRAFLEKGVLPKPRAVTVSWKRTRQGGRKMPLRETGSVLLEFCSSVVRLAVESGLVGWQEVLPVGDALLVEQAVLSGGLSLEDARRFARRFFARHLDRAPLSEIAELRGRIRELEFSLAKAAREVKEMKAGGEGGKSYGGKDWGGVDEDF